MMVDNNNNNNNNIVDISLVCNCCGEAVPGFPGPRLVCPNTNTNGNGNDDGEQHVLMPSHLSLDAVKYLASRCTTQSSNNNHNPFLRYRALLYPYRLALFLGLTDQRYCEIVTSLCCQQTTERLCAANPALVVRTLQCLLQGRNQQCGAIAQGATSHERAPVLQSASRNS